MRVTGEVTEINYCHTKQFFKNRAGKFNEDSPYSVTMYQDHNQNMVKERNQREVDKLYPLLKLNECSKVLDIGCGIGRWADAIRQEIKGYCGMDFSGELIEIANKRNKKENYSFHESDLKNIEEIQKKHEGKYNRVLMIGILMYINDDDLQDLLWRVERVCDRSALICIREPVGLENRLTLKDFYSEELEHNYNAIYRTKDQLIKFFNKTLVSKGFGVVDEGFLFEDTGSLNNRNETAQHYFILER